MALDLAPDYDRLDQLLASVELAPSAAEAQAILCGLLAAPGSDAIGRWYAQLLSPQQASAPGDQTTDPSPPSALHAIDLTFDGRSIEAGDAASDDTRLGMPADDHEHAGDHDHHACEHADGHHHCEHHHHAGAGTESEAAESDALRAALGELARWTEAAIAPPSVSFDLLLPPEQRPLCERAIAVYDWVRGLLFGLTLAGVERDGLDPEAREAFDDLVELTRLDLSAIAEGEEDEQALAEIIEFLRVAAMMIREGASPSPTTSDARGAETKVH